MGKQVDDVMGTGCYETYRVEGLGRTWLAATRP